MSQTPRQKSLRYLFFHIFAADMTSQHIQTKMIVAFTGHRNYCNQTDDALKNAIATLYEAGARHFRVGMAQGFDLAAGKAVAELMATNRNIVLELCIPYPAFASGFDTEERALYDRILNLATIVRYASEHYHSGVYNRRNNMLVDDATHLIAWWDGRRSGTEYTVRRARIQGVITHNLYPDPQLTFSL